MSSISTFSLCHQSQSKHNWLILLGNLYAKNIFLTLSHPGDSVPHLLKLSDDSNQYSDYKVNWCKREAIPFNHFTSPADLASTPIIWKIEGKYFGIIIRSVVEKIYELNGPKLLKTIKQDLMRWMTVPLSWWGTVEVIKINILLRLLSFHSSGLRK